VCSCNSACLEKRFYGQKLRFQLEMICALAVCKFIEVGAIFSWTLIDTRPLNCEFLHVDKIYTERMSRKRKWDENIDTKDIAGDKAILLSNGAIDSVSGVSQPSALVVEKTLSASYAAFNVSTLTQQPLSEGNFRS
jgi:hypothetical protein